MTAEIGLAALWLAAALAVLQMVSGAFALKAAPGEVNALAIHARPAAVVQAFLAVLAFAMLPLPPEDFSIQDSTSELATAAALTSSTRSAAPP